MSKEKERYINKGIITDLREYAKCLPKEIANIYHEDLDILISESRTEIEQLKVENEKLKKEVEKNKKCDNCLYYKSNSDTCVECTVYNLNWRSRYLKDAE